MKIVEYSSYLITLILTIVLIIHWIRNRINPFPRLGFKFEYKILTDLVFALLICLVSVMLIFIIQWSLGFIKIQQFNSPDLKFWLILLFLLIASFIEEILARGIMVNGLGLIFKKNWQIIILVSLFFALGHAANPGVTWLSILSNTLGGVLYTVAFIAAGNIWFPWAIHFFWNAFQFILGYPVSGVKFSSLAVQAETQNSIFHSNQYGPEGDLVGIAIRVIMFLTILIYVQKVRSVDIKGIFL
ncbi:MAG: hypothetical protein APR63_02825 [Desulfuromonas sp. SDB]|nr:MAG: hypothetical protein APR63_02825 [Desulfuromonas sp. SDB]